MKRASAALLVPLVALAQGEALFDDTRSEGSSTPSSAVSASSAAGSTPISAVSAPSSAVSAPFSEWDGITQLFPRPVAASFSHAESAEFAESDSHAESAESAEFDSHAESAENAELGGASSPSEPGSPAGGAAERSEAEGVIQHSAFSIQHSSLPSLSLVSEFPLPDSAPEGLSGIAWTYMPDCAGRPVDYSTRMPDGTDVFAPDSYALCEDSGGRVHWATIALDPESGAVNSVVFRASWNPVGVAATADLEAIAYKRNANRRCALFLSDEASAHIYRRRLSPHGDYDAGACVMSATLPDPMQSPRRNKGVEAMCLSPDNDLLWVANEDSLPEDGPVATTEHGSRVRLYALDASDRRWPHEAPRWWFYPLDPAVGSPFPHLPDPFNGLAELCALPDGRLLALERAYGLRTRGPDDPRASLIAISIYLVDPLSSAARTAAAERPPVLAKTLLWRGLTGRANYEGMTLGPELADGSRALILVSDGDVTRKGSFAFPWSKRLLSFRLRLP